MLASCSSAVAARRGAAVLSGKASVPSLSAIFDNLSVGKSSTRSSSSAVCYRHHHPIGVGGVFSQYQHHTQVLHRDSVQRWFSSDNKNEGGDEVDNAASISTTDNDDNGNTNPSSTGTSGSSQHSTWVQFQQSIAVSGFETGQTVKEKTLGKKSRGGKMNRKRKEREAEAEAALRGEDVTELKGGEFPALRYSDEETERLLTEAYAAIPPRTGKRGTLNLKRQKRRWWIKRQYDYRKKMERIGAHTRKMAKRKRINDEIRETKGGAPGIREKEKTYQDMVLQRWAAMNGHSTEVAVSNERVAA